ncbi:MAG TPA: hypothetical protein VHV51_21785 [Polyangiaceae bacterium]|jgi:hypothetical protein|nr:hypothetical protein [Polyangiaceae bacterium]
MSVARVAPFGPCLLALSQLACGASIRGGYVTRDTPQAKVQTIAAFLPGHCEDASHADRAPRIELVEVVETPSGRTLLFEHRQGYDLLVAENHFDDGPDWVFEVVLNGGDLVRQWRVPRSLGATGKLRVGRELEEIPRAHSFEAKLASERLSCSLVPRSSDLPHGSTNPIR